MAGGSASADLQNQLETLFALGIVGDLSDGQLLRRFLGAPDEAARAAFTALVVRHGPMVLRVCRQNFGDSHEAQDAFQATFLVFARKAGSVRNGESVASWLHGVALRVGGRAKADAARRRVFERRSAAWKAAGPQREADRPESWPELHEEVARLPERYREPVVLCYLEGLTTEAAARRIGCPQGTVLSRLSRARERLRARLIRRGLAPPAVLLAAGLTPVAGAALPTSLLGATTRASWEFAGRRATEAALASASATALARGVLYTMTISKLKVFGAVALAGAITLGGARTLAFQLGGIDAGEVAQSPPRRDPGAAAIAPMPSTGIAIPADLSFDEAVRQALEDANAIEDPAERAEALLGIAISLNERGRLQTGHATLRLALRAAEAIQPNARYWIPHPAIRIAKAMAEAGHREEAHLAFQQALRMVRAEDDPHQVQNWANLPGIQLEAEGRAGSAEMIEAYRQHLMTSGLRPAENPSVASVVVKAMSGDLTGALRAVQDSEDFRGPDGEQRRHSAILAIVGQLRPGDQEVAGPVLAEARTIIDDYARGKPWFRAQDLAAIARAESRLAWFARAIATARAILTEGLDGHLIDSALFQQALTFVEIAKGQAKVGDRAGACDSAREAIAVVGKIHEEGMKPHPLSQACVLLARNGDVAGVMREASMLIPSQRLGTLRAIEAEQRKAGDEAGARATLRLELEDAEANLRKSREREPEANGPEARSNPIVYGTAEVAAIWSRLGDQVAALRVIETLPPGELRDDALAQLASERASQGDIAGARESIGRIGTPRIIRKARIRVAFQAAQVTPNPKTLE